MEIKAPKEFIGKSLKQLNLRIEYGLNVVAIKSRNEKGEDTVNTVPEAEYKIRAQDRLMLVGPNENIKKLESKE